MVKSIIIYSTCCFTACIDHEWSYIRN